ncbi:hypothetical protein LINGRAHAP2_LOCUS20659 [Linum grandiflorum]
MIVVGWPITVHGSAFNLPVEKLYLYFGVGRSFGRSRGLYSWIKRQSKVGGSKEEVFQLMRGKWWIWRLFKFVLRLSARPQVEGSTNLIEFDLYQCSRLEKFINAYGLFLEVNG